MGRISPSKQNMAGKTVNMNGGNATLDVNLYDQFKDQVAKTSGQIADAVMPPLAAAIEKVDDVRQNIVKTADAITPWDDNKLTENFNKTFDTVTQGLVSDYDKAETRIHSTVSGGVTRLTGLDSRIAALVPLVGLTIKDPKFIARGVKQGVASGPDFGPAMQKWRMRRAELQEQMRNPSGSSLSRQKKNASKAQVAAYNDVSTGPTTDPLDVEAYGKSGYKVKGLDQHHLFPKAESYAFVERMRKIGDDDDVLNLFLYAEELDATMGGRLSNMLNMNSGGKGSPHYQLHRNRIDDGRQLKGMGMMNKVNQAKTTDELMDMFDEYIRTNIIPSKAEAKQLQEAFDKARSNLNNFKSLSAADRRRL